MQSFLMGCSPSRRRRRIDDSPITRLLATDTVENHPNSLPKKIQFVSVAPLFGEAIRRIHNRESISAMFPDSNNL